MYTLIAPRLFKKSRLALLSIGATALLSLVAPVSHAATITNNFNTGVVTYTLLNDTADNVANGATAVPVTTFPNLWGPGLMNDGVTQKTHALTGSSFIAPQADQSNATRPQPANTYSGTTTYQTTFNLTGTDLSTINLAISMYADNWAQVLINGNVVHTQTSGITTGQPLPLDSFTLSYADLSAFLNQGVNTISFLVNNTRQTSSCSIADCASSGPTGLDATVAVTTGTPDVATPEPSTYLQIGLGLVAGSVIALRRRRMANHIQS